MTARSLCLSYIYIYLYIYLSGYLLACVCVLVSGKQLRILYVPHSSALDAEEQQTKTSCYDQLTLLENGIEDRVGEGDRERE